MKFLFTVLLFLFSLSAFGQNYWSRAKIAKNETSSYGILLSDGSWLIEPIYDQIVLHSTHSTNPKNFFIVEKDGKWGLYTHSGKFILPVQYDDLHLYSNFIHVEKDGKQGAYNFEGKKLLSCTHEKVIYASYDDYIHIIPQGDYIVFGHEGYFGAIDTEGKLIVPANNDYIIQRNSFLEAKKNGASQVYNRFGTALPLEEYTEFKGNDYSQHPFHHYLRVKKDDKWGMVDVNGKVLLEPKYTELYINKDKYVYLKDGHKNGIALYSGEIILDPIYSGIRQDEYHPLFVFSMDQKRGLCNFEGKQLLPLEYNEIRIYPEYIKFRKGEKYGLSDTNGRIILEAKYDNIETPYGSRMAFFSNNGKLGAVSWSGNQIVPAAYDELYDNRNWIFGRKDGKQFGFNLNGKTLFSDAENMRKMEELLFFQKGGKWAAVNLEGKQIIPPNYSDIGHSMNYGPLPAEKNGKWGYINEKNETVIPFMYDEAFSFFADNNALVTKNGMRYRINKQNERISEESIRPAKKMEEESILLTPPIDMGYNRRRQLRKLSQWRLIQQGDKVGLQKDSVTFLPAQYDTIILSELPIVLAQHDEKWSLIDSSGKELRELHDIELSPFYPLYQKDTKNHEIVNVKYSASLPEGEIIPFDEALYFTWINSNEKREQKVEQRGYYLNEEVRQHPQFPGGYNKIQPYIQEEMEFPSKAKKLKESAIVYAKCMVETDGTMSSIRIEDTSLAPYFKKEAERILKNFPPLTPGKNLQNNSIRTEIIIPVFFDYHERFEK